MAKPRLLAILSEYPQLSQTYKENELRALMPYVELKIASYAKHDTGYHDHLPFSVCRDPAQILVEARAFGPHQIHGHYYHLIPILHRAAEICGCPGPFAPTRLMFWGNRVSTWSAGVIRSTVPAARASSAFPL